MATTTTDDSVSRKFESALSDLKLERITANGEAEATQVSLLSLLQHEALRTETRLGSQHPRTLQLKARLQAALQVIHTLQVEGQLSRIEVPEIVKDGALIHGRIVDEDGLGIDKLIVCLVDQSGAMIRDTGEPTTDTSGYFAISLEPDAVDRLLKKYANGIFLAVFTPRRRLVHQQPKPLTVAHGAVLEVEIPLDRDTLTATPSTPPTAIVVPDLFGLTEHEGAAALQKLGLKVGEIKTKVVTDQAGRVLDQSPAAGTKVKPGSSVSLVIGVQSNTIKVPSVIGQTLKDGKEAITKSGLILGKISGKSQSDESIVRSQDPKPETEIAAGTPVNVAVAPPAQNEIKDILDRMAKDKTFVEIDMAVTKLEKRLNNRSIETREQLASLLQSSDKDLKENLRLPNLNAARVFNSLLRKALGEN